MATFNVVEKGKKVLEIYVNQYLMIYMHGLTSKKLARGIPAFPDWKIQTLNKIPKTIIGLRKLPK